MSKTIELLTANCGKIKPDSIEEYIKAGGYKGLEAALHMTPLDVIEEVRKSKLMGRGGAAYPTGTKWLQAYEIQKFPKYIVCNADEGEPGTLKDKYIMDGDPFKLIEGMTIAAFILKSESGQIYIRGEYKQSQKIMKAAIDAAVKAGYLGQNILGKNFNFNLEVISGAGAYVCGENSALVESAEGKAGRPRIKPPFIKNVGFRNMPTLLNNVETFACIPVILEKGGETYANYGTEFSGGTKIITLSGNVVNKGVYEVPFGITLRELIYDIGGGIPNGRKLKMVQMGGSSGACFTEKLLDTPLCYKTMKEKGITLGSGAILVVDDSNCIVDFAKCISEFFVHESCGKCTPCREGNKQLLNILEKFSSGKATKQDFVSIERIASTMKNGSFCGLGQTAATALTTCLKYFKEEFEAHINHTCYTNTCNLSEGEK